MMLKRGPHSGAPAIFKPQRPIDGRNHTLTWQTQKTNPGPTN